MWLKSCRWYFHRFVWDWERTILDRRRTIFFFFIKEKNNFLFVIINWNLDFRPMPWIKHILYMYIELCSLPKLFRSFSSEMSKMSLCKLKYDFRSKPSRQPQNSIFSFPSTPKNPKSANFWVKIFIPNHCKSSGNKFLRSSSIIEQVMYPQNSSHFDWFFWLWRFFVSRHRAQRELTHARFKRIAS